MDLSSGSRGSMQGERRALERIRERCNTSILEACRHSPLPVEFLGALTANESAGVATAARFEPAVYSHLRAVANGQGLAVQTAWIVFFIIACRVAFNRGVRRYSAYGG